MVGMMLLLLLLLVRRRRRFGRVMIHVNIFLFRRLAHGRLPSHIPGALAVHPAVLNHAPHIIETLSYIGRIIHHNSNLGLVGQS